jgi:predicted O-methyltransferase YrrM
MRVTVYHSIEGVIDMVLSLLRKIVAASRVVVRRGRVLATWIAVQRLTSELSQTSGYSFTTDYGSQFVADWEEALAKLKGQQGIRMLEIGSYEGRSTIWFVENILTSPTASIVCVDPFFNPFVDARFDHNMAVSGFQHKITKVKGSSEAAVPSLPRDHFDVIYVDGSHRSVHVLMDAVLAWYRLKAEGFIIFDDYLWEEESLPLHERPRMAIDLFLEAFDSRVEVVHKAYQVIVRKHVM